MYGLARKLPLKYYLKHTKKAIICCEIRLFSNKVECKPPNPPKRAKSSTGTLYTLGALALVSGATLSYAKYDPEFRKNLVEVAPFTDGVIKFVFQEEKQFSDVLQGVYEHFKLTMSDVLKKSEKIEKTKIEEYKAPKPIVPVVEKSIKKDEEKYNEIRLEKKEDSTLNVEFVGDVKPRHKDTHPLNLADLEEKTFAATTEAVNAYMKAIEYLQNYSQDIQKILDCPTGRSLDAWDRIQQNNIEKGEAVKLAKEKAAEANKYINRLKDLLSKKDCEAPETAKESIIQNILRAQDDIEKAKAKFDEEVKKNSVTDRFWDKVEKSRKHFNKELQILFPDVDIKSKKFTINEHDLDLFLTFVYSHVLFYQKELAKMETVMQDKLQKAVAAARNGGGEPLTHAQICEALEQERRRLCECFDQECLKLRAESEAELREQLKRQSQAFSDHLDDAVKTRAGEIERDLVRKFDEQIEQERNKFKTQLAAIVGRLKGLDQALKLKDDADKIAKRSQVLWSACQGLLAAIKTGCPGIPWKFQLRPLQPEITNVQKSAAEGDELVEVVIKSIPQIAKERGVFPEDALRERFLKVEKMARNLALVPEHGASLPIYVLSYIQSMLLIKNASQIPKNELNDETIDFSKMTTNEILQRARYWLDRGDLAQSLKYMNLLKGAPRTIAKQWMDETRILLETQQAANTLMAHASSSGLMYL